MSQQNLDPKKRIPKLIESTLQKLQSLGIDTQLKYKSTNQPWTDLQNFCQDLVFLIQQYHSELGNKNNQNGQGEFKCNENIVLESIREFKNVYIMLSKFAKFLLDGQQSRELCKSYRKLHKSISTISNTIYKYQSQDQNFEKQKYQLINQNIKISQQLKMDSQSNNQNVPYIFLQKIQQNNQQSQNDQQTINDLEKQIQILNQIMRKNDQQYTQQIQSYNNTLYGMQETIREYQMRMDKVKQYEAVIDQLEHKLIRLKEQKYRDDMLIDNMSKKIRIYEKQRNGVDAFISPRGSFSRKNLISPSNRTIYPSHNQTGYPHLAGGGTLPMRNYY